jgi:hypothetical protein
MPRTVHFKYSTKRLQVQEEEEEDGRHRQTQ